MDDYEQYCREMEAAHFIPYSRVTWELLGEPTASEQVNAGPPSWRGDGSEAAFQALLSTEFSVSRGGIPWPAEGEQR